MAPQIATEAEHDFIWPCSWISFVNMDIRETPEFKGQCFNCLSNCKKTGRHISNRTQAHIEPLEKKCSHAVLIHTEGTALTSVLMVHFYP